MNIYPTFHRGQTPAKIIDENAIETKKAEYKGHGSIPQQENLENIENIGHLSPIPENIIIPSEHKIEKIPQKDTIITHMISASKDNSLRIWNRTGECEGIKRGNDAFQRILEIGKYIIATKYNGSMDVLMNTSPYTKLFGLTGHRGGIPAICKLRSTQGATLIATGGDDASIRIWDLDARECVGVLDGGHKSAIKCLIQHSTGCLISGSLDSKVIIWNINDRQIVKTLSQENYSTVYGIIELFNHKIFSYYNNSKIRVKEWDLEEMTNNMILTTYDVEHKGFTSGVQISDNFVLLGAENGNLDLYKCSPYIHIISKYSNIHNSSITQILTINQTFVITCSTDKTIKIFDVKSESVVDEYEKLHSDSVEDILIQVILPEKHIIDKIVLIIGGYKLPVKKEKLLRIAPIFKQFIGEEDAIELPYYDSDISYNEILLPYITKGKFIIRDEILSECIIMSIYFPFIKDKCDQYITLNQKIIDNSFAANVINEIFLSALDSYPEKSSIYIYIYIIN